MSYKSCDCIAVQYCPLFNNIFFIYLFNNINPESTSKEITALKYPPKSWLIREPNVRYVPFLLSNSVTLNMRLLFETAGTFLCSPCLNAYDTTSLYWHSLWLPKVSQVSLLCCLKFMSRQDTCITNSS